MSSRVVSELFCPRRGRPLACVDERNSNRLPSTVPAVGLSPSVLALVEKVPAHDRPEKAPSDPIWSPLDLRTTQALLVLPQSTCHIRRYRTVLDYPESPRNLLKVHILRS